MDDFERQQQNLKMNVHVNYVHTIGISISIRRKLMLMIMSRLSSLAYKLLMLIFMLMLASLVKTGLKSYLDRSFSPAKGYDEHRSLPFYMSPLGEQSVVLERCTCYTGSR